jgi:hypothetical protein
VFFVCGWSLFKFFTMPFKPGEVNNPYGRPVGSINIKPQIVQQHLFEVYINNIPKLEVELGKLEGKQFLDEMLGIVSYLIPKGLIVANYNAANKEEEVIEVFRIGGKDLIFNQ